MAETIVDVEALKKVAIELNDFPKVVPKAMSAALNRAISKAKTEMRREVIANYEVKSDYVKESLSVKKATPSRLSAEAISVGRPIALAHFKFKPKQPMAGITRRKVMVKVKKSEGYAVIKTKQPAFVQNPNGAINIFMRSDKQRLPIKRLYNVSVPQMISNKEVLNRITEKAQQTLNERVDHEIKHRLEKIKGSDK